MIAVQDTFNFLIPDRNSDNKSSNASLYPDSCHGYVYVEQWPTFFEQLNGAAKFGTSEEQQKVTHSALSLFFFEIVELLY